MTGVVQDGKVWAVLVSLWGWQRQQRPREVAVGFIVLSVWAFMVSIVPLSTRVPPNLSEGECHTLHFSPVGQSQGLRDLMSQLRPLDGASY